MSQRKNWKTEFNKFVISEEVDGSHLIEPLARVKEEILVGIAMATKVKHSLDIELEEVENALVFINNKK